VAGGEVMTEIIEIDGYTVTIVIDDGAANPLKECDSPGTLATWHRRYNLGTEQPDESPEDYLSSLVPSSVSGSFEERENRISIREYDNRYSRDSGKTSFRFDYDSIRNILESQKRDAIQKWINDNLVLINVYMYEHSGIVLSSFPFSCPWDSGQLGVYFLTREEVEKEFGGDKERARTYLEGSLETYGDYISGAVFGIDSITAPVTTSNACGTEVKGEELEEGSVWGFYGSDHEKSGLMESARNCIELHKKKSYETKQNYY
jgi:hypothetical protein